MNQYQTYLEALAEAYRDGGTEHTGRAPLENLLRAVADSSGSGYHIQHEPIRDRESGAPDFKIKRKGRILGYVEVKKIGANLDEVLKSEQIGRYKLLSGNIVLTDYLQFVWLKDGKVNGRESLAYPSDLEGRRPRVSAGRAEAVAKLFHGFFSTAPEDIGRAQDLALALAARCRLLRDYLGEELVRQERDKSGGKLVGLYQAFCDQVFAELTLAEFADAFAQTLGYGFFLAKFNAANENATIDLHNVKQFVPRSFELIRELVDFLEVLDQARYEEIRWVVDEIVSLINGLDLAALHEDLSFAHRKLRRGIRAKSDEEARLFERDPYIYFYEDFLQRYDPKARESRGVYYTPPPVVNFIVRAIDDILRDTFGIAEGLADHERVTVLDFACGTGTFLVEVFEKVFDTLGPDSGKRDLIVAEHLLKNVFGFEYLIAPYTIAHLKLSQYLADKGRPLKEGERLKVYLTNTLEPIEADPPQYVMDFLPALANESKGAQRVKERPILVITGNPPYSGISRNMGTAAQALVERYKYVDGQHFGERKHWLQDDYVKFIAFAQNKMNDMEEGIVGIITNHSFLDNPTFRGMRQSLMETFQQLYVLNLHGNSLKKEVSPDGSADKNVFDIRQGVAISLLVKAKNAPRGLWHSDLWGDQLYKYRALSIARLRDVEWRELKPDSPYYFFVPRENQVREEYLGFLPLRDIFPINVAGIITARDRFVIAVGDDELLARLHDFTDATISDNDIRSSYRLKDTRGWKLSGARRAVARQEVSGLLQDILYRPFDKRRIAYDQRLVDWGREDVMRHMTAKNIALLSTRVTKEEGTFYCTDSIAAHKSASVYDITYLFPLYIYAPQEGAGNIKADLFGSKDPFRGRPRIENIAPAFRHWLDERYGHHFSPEEVLGTIYAVLHAPTYRERYREFLRIDFPRIPFPEARAGFEALSALGWDLVQKHLLRDVPALGLGRYRREGEGETHEVEKPRYSEAEERLWINKSQFFAPVPKPVWELHIGGYQVLAKHLKDRKGRTLSLAEIDNVEKVVNVLAFTLRQMQRIDAAYREAFPEAEEAEPEAAE